MVLGVKEPAEFARQVEEHPQLPPGALGNGRVASFITGVPDELSVSVPAMEVL